MEKTHFQYNKHKGGVECGGWGKNRSGIFMFDMLDERNLQFSPDSEKKVYVVTNWHARTVGIF